MPKCLLHLAAVCDRPADEEKFVDDHHWIEENEMLDLVAIAQSAPGPIGKKWGTVVE